jgi:hypothetical protein
MRGQITRTFDPKNVSWISHVAFLIDVDCDIRFKHFIPHSKLSLCHTELENPLLRIPIFFTILQVK